MQESARAGRSGTPPVRCVLEVEWSEQVQEGILRCLKRYIARETYRAILLDARAYLPSGQQDKSVEV